MKRFNIKVNISTRLLAYFLFVAILPLFFLTSSSTLLLYSSLNDILNEDLNYRSDFIWKEYNNSIIRLRNSLKQAPTKQLKINLEAGNTNKNSLKSELANISQKNNFNIAILLNSDAKPVSSYLSNEFNHTMPVQSNMSLNYSDLTKQIKNDVLISTEIFNFKDLSKQGLINKTDINNDSGYLVQTGLVQFEVNKHKYYLLAGNLINQNSDFYKEIKNTGDTAFLVSQNNNVILSNLPKEKEELALDISIDKTNQNNIFNKKIFIGGEEYRSSIYIIRNISGKVVANFIIGIPEKYIGAIKLKNSALNFEIALLIALAGITLAYLLARTITKPLLTVIDAARAIESGDFTKRVNIKSTDELGYLSQSFNSMAEALQKRSELEQMKEDFVATLTHDLRVPLLASVQTLEYLKKGSFGNLEEKQEFIIEQLISNNKDLLNMVNTILDSHKYEAGKQNLNKRKINLNNLIEECVADLESLANEKKHTISFIPDNQDIEITADRHEIKRVIQNLLGNAIIYTQEKGAIEIYTNTGEDEIIISIKDNGAGIPESSMKNLFERYSKGSKTLRKVGTGLGLYLSKQIIEAHNGKIWAESIKDSGSTFYFSIPTEKKSGLDNDRQEN